MAKPGLMKGCKNPHIGRYSAVRMRQLIADNLKSSKPKGWGRLYTDLLIKGEMPAKSDGDVLGATGFSRQFKQVKKDLNHTFTPFFLGFLHRAARSMCRIENQVLPEGYNGCREISQMTGLQEVTIKDILILEGWIK